MSDTTRSTFPGVILIVLGVIFLLANTGVVGISWENFWPLILLGVGLLFEFGAFAGKEKQAGLLVPGGILLTISFIFLVCVFFGWHWMETLWPLFILAPAIGLFQLYIFGKREPGLLVPVGILSVLGLTFLFINLGLSRIFNLFFPALLVLLGVFLLFKKP